MQPLFDWNAMNGPAGLDGPSFFALAGAASAIGSGAATGSLARMHATRAAGPARAGSEPPRRTCSANACLQNVRFEDAVKLRALLVVSKSCRICA